jgi:cytochrome P450
MAPPPTALPAGPTTPAWWQLVRFAGDPLGLLDECHRRYGDAFTLNVAGNGRFVMLSDPDAVRDVFRGDPDALHSGEANALFTATVGPNSVLVLDGAPHARQRRVVVPPLEVPVDSRRRNSCWAVVNFQAVWVARCFTALTTNPPRSILRSRHWQHDSNSFRMAGMVVWYSPLKRLCQPTIRSQTTSRCNPLA